MFQQIPLPLLEDIRIHSPGQLRVNPVLGIELLTINNRLPPFDRPAVRQALNYAIDRGEIVRLYGGPTVAEPTCQVLPPGIPGYRRYCPYTRHARADGGWAAPDLARARRLVAASGTVGARVTIGVFIDELSSRRAWRATSPASFEASATAPAYDSSRVPTTQPSSSEPSK